MNPFNYKPLQFSTLLFFVLNNFASLFAQTKSLLNIISYPDTSFVREIRLDPNAIQVQNDVSAIMDSVVYIPLQTTKESLFGEIAQLEITDDYYIIGDQTTNSIYFFGKSGNYKYKITSKTGNVKIPFKKIKDFYIDRSKNQIVLTDIHSPYNYYYTLSGKYITQKERLRYEDSGGMNIGDVVFHYQNYSKTAAEAGLPNANLVVTRDQQVKKLYLPFDTAFVNYTDLFSMYRNFYSSSDHKIYFSQSYDYHIYELEPSGNLSVSYKFILPALNSLPLNFMHSKEYLGFRQQYTTKFKDIIYAMGDFYKLGNAIVFKLFGIKYFDDVVLLNLVSGNAYSINDLIADKSSYMLPAFGKEIIGTNDSGGIISSIPSITLLQARNKLIEKGFLDKNIPENLSEFFRGDSNQNPCLVVLYPKAKL